MKKILVVLVLTILLVNHAYSACCVPKQIEFLGLSMGQIFKVSYDGNVKKAYANGTVNTNEVTMTQESLQDFTTNTQYTVINGKCYKSPIPLNLFLTCLPSDAKLVLSTYYGFGGKKIDIHVYTFRLNEIEISVSVTPFHDTCTVSDTPFYDACTVSVTPFHDTCILVSAHVSMRTGIIDIEFMGTTIGIKDPSVLNIPQQCQEQRTLVDDPIIV